MGKLVVDMFVTLDGVIQAPGGPEEDPSERFEHGGWMAPLNDEDSGRAIGEYVLRMDALLLGRKTYDIFASYWPKAGDFPIANTLNTVPKHVVSTTLTGDLAWNNST